VAPDPSRPRPGDYVYIKELPEAVSRVRPEYPEELRRRGIEGTVMVQVLVATDGLVEDVRIVKSIPDLDPYAVAAAREWKFKPALAGGKPVATWVGVPIKFPPQ
jgi:protein TonB